MKYLKVALLAFVAGCTFINVNAQTTSPHHPSFHRAAMLHHRYHHNRPAALARHN
ncbi:MAG: hypothetical protein ACXVAY_04565 [Mucilaginibacter sp.]